MPGRGGDTIPEPAGPVPERATLLVCDFTNSNRNPDIEWMSIAVADMSITDLSQCGFLKVISREELNTALAKAGAGRKDMIKDLVAFAGKLDAEIILKGSVAKLGSDIRIDIQLLDGSDGSLILAAGEVEPEETFFNAIDELSVQLRKRIAGYLEKKHPGMKCIASADDLSIEKQYFTARFPEEPETGDVAEEALGSDGKIGNKSLTLSGGSAAPAPMAKARESEKKQTELKRSAVAQKKPEAGEAGNALKAEGAGPVRQSARREETGSSRGKGDGALKQPVERLRKPENTPGAVDKAPENRQLQKHKPSQKFIAIRAFYKACELIEQDTPEARKQALDELDTALKLNPGLLKARELREKLLGE